MKIKNSISLPKRLLLELVTTYGAMVLLHNRLHNPTRALYPDYYAIRDYERLERKQRQALGALKNSKMIDMRKKGGKIYFALTDKARQWILRQQCKGARLCSNNECILVIFDIPEAQRFLRDSFRLFLKEHEFRQLQRSVWMSDKDLFLPLKAFIEVSGAAPWVEVFRASRS